jgi:hypothetical protein
VHELFVRGHRARRARGATGQGRGAHGEGAAAHHTGLGAGAGHDPA